MSYAVDQSRMVKGFFVQQLFQIICHLPFIAPVGDFPLHLFKHLHYFNVGTTVTGAFQGTDGCCDDRVGVGQGGGNYMGGERRVVTAAVLHMQDQGDIQNSGLQRRIFIVRAKNM